LHNGYSVNRYTTATCYTSVSDYVWHKLCRTVRPRVGHRRVRSSDYDVPVRHRLRFFSSTTHHPHVASAPQHTVPIDKYCLLQSPIAEHSCPHSLRAERGPDSTSSSQRRAICSACLNTRAMRTLRLLQGSTGEFGDIDLIDST
jgi:hypothetical protein